MTSPPDASQISAIAFIKDIFVARNELAATFTSSAVGRSALIHGTPLSRRGLYALLRISSARSEITPTTNRFGRSVSSTAKPSLRNSGFQANSAFEPNSFSLSTSRSAVPTGTVDLPTTSEPALACGAMASIAASTYRISAAREPFNCGVPTQMKWTSQSFASEKSVVNCNLPELTSAKSNSSRSGSKKGTFPLRSSSIFWASTSIPITSKPRDAIAAACVAPRYPVPITDNFIGETYYPFDSLQGLSEAVLVPNLSTRLGDADGSGLTLSISASSFLIRSNKSADNSGSQSTAADTPFLL